MEDPYELKRPEHPLRAFFVGVAAVAAIVSTAVLGSALLAVGLSIFLIVGGVMFIAHLCIPNSK